MDIKIKINLRKRAIYIYKIIRHNDTATLRQLAEESSIPKSSVHRHKKNIQIRVDSIGHSFFETDAGHAWLHRLFFSVIFIFGVQAGVGAETISLFFNTVFLNAYVATSPTTLRDVKKKIRELTDIYGEEQMEEIIKRCKNKELHLGGDETVFGKSVFLILMELTSGFIFTEALVEDRKLTTWQKCVGKLLSQFKKILSFTSDGGQALIQLGKSVGCENIMDLFHLLQDVRKLFATKFHSKRSSLQSQLKKLTKESLTSDVEQSQAITTINNKLAVLDKGQSDYHTCLFEISTNSHPFKDTSQIQTSEELKGVLQSQLTKLRETAKVCEIEDKNNLLNRFERRIEPLAQLNDLWHNWVEQSIQCKTTNSDVKQWATQKLLPLLYWQQQVKKSKKKDNLKNYYQALADKAQGQLDAEPLTAEYLTSDWMQWGRAMVLKYQRASSQIEGRNARLAEHYFSARGIRPSHVNSLTVLNNFHIKRNDNTTASERLCGYKPPDLFEYILEKMGAPPLPRNRQRAINASTVQPA